MFGRGWLEIDHLPATLGGRGVSLLTCMSPAYIRFGYILNMPFSDAAAEVAGFLA
jgi:hypothetical protein